MSQDPSTTLTTPIAIGRTAEIFAWRDGTILKLYRTWCPPDWVDYEAKVAAIVTQSGVPAPKSFEIVEVNGRRGLVYERVGGVSMLKQLSRQPLKLAAFGKILADLHFEMHRHTVPALPPQRGGLERAIHSAKLLPEELRAAALQRLASLPDGDRLCHGDFHPDNVLLTSKGPLIIDWMTANRGDPWADVARTHLLLTTGQPVGSSFLSRLMLLGRQQFFQAYRKQYEALNPGGNEQLRVWLPVMAAARLNENIENEQGSLLRVVREGFAKGGPNLL
jgi:tRNA A-37 threonylcarbamoyl transferase component Bud32